LGISLRKRLFVQKQSYHFGGERSRAWEDAAKSPVAGEISHGGPVFDDLLAICHMAKFTH
jgi:hypothetical protein